MNVPLSEFNEEQRLWYGYMVASATKADGAVDSAEIEFLINTFHFLTPVQTNEIKGYLKSSEMKPELSKIPSGLSKAHLATVFTELIWIIISDGKLTKSEVDFIKKISKWFNFSEDYFKKTLQWGEQMLKAEKYRRALVKAAE